MSQERDFKSGIEQILLESDTVAGGSSPGVMSGHDYNRALRSHKLLAEAFERLRWQAFMNRAGQEDKTK